MTTDLTTEILKQIRDGIKELREDFNRRLDQTNEQLDQANERLDQTNGRLDQTNSRLGRVEQGLNDLGKFMRQIALDQAKHERFHVQHVERLEEDVTVLKARVQRLEQRPVGWAGYTVKDPSVPYPGNHWNHRNPNLHP